MPVAPVGSEGVPVKAGDAKGAPPTPVTSARSNVTAPDRVLNVVTPMLIAPIAVPTKAVVASAVELLPAVCVMPVAPVGSDGVPVNAGLASGRRPRPSHPPEAA